MTVAQGVITWNDFKERVIYTIQQEGKNQYLTDLSRNVSRSFRQMAEAGDSPNGKIPYGFDKRFLDNAGNEICRIRRGEPGPRKERDWKILLVPSDDQQAVETVRWLFETYQDNDVSLGWIADELHRRKVLSPSGKTFWNRSFIAKLFANPVYAGDFVYGRQRRGKYHFVSAQNIEQVSAADSWKKRTLPKPEHQWIVKRNAHEALVSRRLFDVVQRKLTERRDRSTPRHKFGDLYVLSGLLHCENCGKRMCGQPRRGRPVYMCSGYMQHGRKNQPGCLAWTTPQSEIVEVVKLLLLRLFETDDHKAKLRVTIQNRVLSQIQTDPEAIQRMEKSIARLEQQIDHARKRILIVPKNQLEGLYPKIDSWQSEKERLVSELKRARRARKPETIDAEIDAVYGRIENLCEELNASSTPRLREVIRRMVRRIDLRWESKSA